MTASWRFKPPSLAHSLRALTVAALAMTSAGCGDDSNGGGAGGSGGGGGGTCGPLLFGAPGPKTGLSDSQCGPGCGCGDEAFEAPAWTSERVAALLTYTQLDAPAELTADPYAQMPAPTAAPEGSVCAALFEDVTTGTYRTQTFASQAEAAGASAIVTHHGGCGLCSSLEDLAVYAGVTDLTGPVRQCGVDSFGQGLDANVSCLEGLGFTRPCAQIWAYNTQNTRSQCLATCSALLDAPYHEPSGELNECLRCDEENSGPVFKAVAGRTRRNTGVASALCRPCNEVKPVDHQYP